MLLQCKIDRAAAFRLGFPTENADFTMDVPVPGTFLNQMPQEDRDLIAARLDQQGRLWSRNEKGCFCTTKCNYHSLESATHYVSEVPILITITEPGLDGILKAIRAEEAVIAERAFKEAEERRVEADKLRQRTQEVIDLRRTRTSTENVSVRRTNDGDLEYDNGRRGGSEWATAQYEIIVPHWPYDHDTDVATSAQAKAWKEDLDRLNTVAETDARVRAVQKLINKEVAEVAAKKKDEQQAVDRENWIAEYGSDRLRRCVQEGIEHDSLYIQERLAKERPGWKLERKTPGTDYDPKNPSSKAFELLDKARETAPDAVLRWWVDTHEHDDKACDEECDREYDFRGYVAMAKWLDRDIVFGYGG